MSGSWGSLLFGRSNVALHQPGHPDLHRVLGNPPWAGGPLLQDAVLDLRCIRNVRASGNLIWKLVDNDSLSATNEQGHVLWMLFLNAEHGNDPKWGAPRLVEESSDMAALAAEVPFTLSPTRHRTQSPRAVKSLLSTSDPLVSDKAVPTSCSSTRWPPHSLLFLLGVTGFCFCHSVF